jgi:hypothetical protein
MKNTILWDVMIHVQPRFVVITDSIFGGQYMTSKMDAVRPSETPVKFYRSIRCHIPEGFTFYVKSTWRLFLPIVFIFSVVEYLLK